MRFKKIFSVLLVVTLLFSFSSCFLLKDTSQTAKKDLVTLTYYKLFDNEDVLKPLLEKFQSKYPHIRVNYKKFNDYDEYYNLILNELAEGEGPDIFSMPNTWIGPNTKKLIPAPLTTITPEQTEEVFVSVAAKDVLHYDKDGFKKMFGVPLTVDTLALYYNKEHIDDALAEQGAPSKTWEGIKEDVFRLTKKDNSFERFFRAGIAMGMTENISRSTDIIYLLLLQFNADIYDKNFEKFQFNKYLDVINQNPAAEALTLFTSFAQANNKNYSWNEFISNSENPEKELEAFVTGKLSMMINYSFAYDQLVNLIKTKKASGIPTIDPASIRVAPIPQVFDPKISPDKRKTYASYFVEVVSRNSQKSEEAWTLLSFLAGKENLQYYFEKSHRPTSRRDLIAEQSKEPIYGVFVNQIGYAESFPIYDIYYYSEVIGDAIKEALLTGRYEQSMMTAQRRLQDRFPKKNLIPPPPPSTKK